MNTEKTIKNLKKKRTDTIYGKKKHFNAAQRKNIYDNIFTWLTIILSALTSVSLFPQLTNFLTKWTGEGFTSYITFLLSLTLTIILGLQKHFKFNEQAELNSKVGNSYLGIGKDIDDILAFMEDGILQREQISEKVNSIQKRINETNSLGSKAKTNNKDFEKARKGVANGEEDYTSEELNIWD